jgi:hypothetical protein
MPFKESINRLRRDKEFLIFFGIFLLLWIYVIIRVNTVFYIYDEIHTKWIYMVEWNYLPYSGYIDANNHFLNSFLGGLFIRLFNSDAMWIVRFPSMLAFPIYFWAIYGFRHHFQHKINFYAFASLFLFSAFLLDYFGLARGYGLSIAFLILAFQQMMSYFTGKKRLNVLGIVISWLGAVFANLTLLPFAMAAMVFILIFQVNKKKYAHILPILISLIPIIYLVKYSFHLKEIGKLYYGGQDGFFTDTVHSLTPYLWDTKSIYLDILLIFLFLVIVVITSIRFFKERKLFDPKILFSLFLILAVVNILAQHYILDINFPEDRSALYLIVFFFGALPFAIDRLENKRIAVPFIAIPVVFFLVHLNFSHSVFFFYEHFDEKLLTSMEEDVNGIPPSSGGRFWNMDNELSRTNNLPSRALQEMYFPADTILDYLITTKGLLPDYVENMYSEKYFDNISTLTLYERKQFLNRKKVNEQITAIGGINEYYTLWEAKSDKAHYIRLSGYLKDMNIFRKSLIIFNSESNDRSIIHYSNYFNLIESRPIDENGSLHFDFTIALNDFPDSTNQIVFYWNPNKFEINGEIKAEIYEIVE